MSSIPMSSIHPSYPDDSDRDAMARFWFEHRTDPGVFDAISSKQCIDGEMRACAISVTPGVDPFKLRILPNGSDDVRIPVGSAGKERSASRIQAAWKRAIANPQYAMCRQRLEREFSSMDVDRATAV